MVIKDRNTLVAVGVALFFIGVSLYVANIGENSGGNGEKTVSLGNERAYIPERESPALGKNDAKAVLVEFSDFQCPHCATFHFGAGAVIFDRYIKTGQVKMIYKHFPLLGEESYAAAYASECAREQGKFWEYHDALFDQQARAPGENSGTFSVSNLIGYAQRTGLNSDVFAQCLHSEKYKERVARDIEDGKSAQVTGTPAIFIQGKRIDGAAAFSEYQRLIEEALQNNK
ncbi:hypothetical protein A3C91_03505 [Candidatus Azambacteria bacterium RIFCSPHIGHO2_02_FULL_52_12]|uniref:Thioredoxin domain-containing protein n=1 Tax=Candidatus Azambacteria bacterium RIFCSPLOWO2_01_FULL_46_25 TaxID=1797298 RepID=A0A1F5BVY5_9BACT|nr:MAG: hypothetical protein A3C91_03505 [Candidatus Azambacteria bacterium RIFCSPHIGHO2_02_FULL_52_12]OGD34770.1 MAG: hypothetical protein A2988_04735 [Candidatus Azambacteria bacterium RIFCSPLOWO2_01_FULL_46_25]OGD37895.1 MAG: hypothetical protein A2850_04810 [Candidatus Azambacteria bacterium RIFCSPHIGHO2_01_FULL_51_74]